MTRTLSRLALCRGRLTPEPDPIRPPHALNDYSFTDACDRRGACIDACPENIIVRGGGGFPEIQFTSGACTFCDKCVDACKSGALHIANHVTAPWTASISDKCLSMCGTTCRICEESCDERAIRLRLALGGAADPRIDATVCTGCGACVAPCPVGAIIITSDHSTIAVASRLRPHPNTRQEINKETQVP